MMMFLVGVALGFAIATGGKALLALPQVRSVVEKIIRRPLPVAVQSLVASPLAARIDAAIAEIEAQIRNRIDVERNLTRQAILREVKGE